jgi:carboxypeptidase Q
MENMYFHNEIRAKIIRKNLVILLISCIFISLFFRPINSQFSKRQKPDNFTLAVTRIKEALANNSEIRHSALKRTAYLVDTFGPRLWGSETLELAIKWVRDELDKEGFENVRLEEVPNVPKWVRGEERLIMLSPRPFPSKIPLVGLGKSVGGNVTAEVIMFRNFEEMENNSEQIKGKIVFLNANWTTYGETVKYRSAGPSKAAKYGALAYVIRSVASKSLENAHTGALSYDEAYPKIPSAAVSLESADMFARMIERGQKIVLNLYMEAHYEGLTTSHNVIGEYRGSVFPNEVILMGGHIDSWDVGPQTGANDDAAGFMVCFEAIRTLIKLGLRPKRTLRFIAWSGEEMGEPTSGAQAYARTHKNEMDDHVIAFESDLGTRKIHGWGFSGDEKAYAIVKTLNQLFLNETLNLTHVDYNQGVMTDTEPLYEKYKVPVMRNLIQDTPDSEYYFTYHHSAGDNINILDADDMDSNVAAIASMFYILGSVPAKLPKY